ncbi:hypothetical protein [Culicoidibacter larvae]|uniref:DUF2479 domain-containing protein n=1 Tax=Culicoidibacter larvae TaxID=2579976 RepID=A0A5R8QFK2_9FIRM|nr:hypothetical protein [Culicoidibacter larvae]TLG75243.1 hypothetical protein FEZ08_04145 [Culicoidibacter larvae]
MGALEKLRETAQKIRESVYGVEVREDIAEGFENVVDAQNEYEVATTAKFETKLNTDFGQFAEELTVGVSEYVNDRVEERIVEVMDDLSDDNLRSEIQQARNSAAYAVNYASVDARLEADETKLKDVVSEVNAARNSAANGKTYSNLDSRLEEDEGRLIVTESKLKVEKVMLTPINGAQIFSDDEKVMLLKVGNMVYLCGAMKNITKAGTYLNIPVGFRPSQPHTFVNSGNWLTTSNVYLCRWQTSNKTGNLDLQAVTNADQYGVNKWFPVNTSWIIE